MLSFFFFFFPFLSNFQNITELYLSIEFTRNVVLFMVLFIVVRNNNGGGEGEKNKIK